MTEQQIQRECQALADLEAVKSHLEDLECRGKRYTSLLTQLTTDPRELYISDYDMVCLVRLADCPAAVAALTAHCRVELSEINYRQKSAKMRADKLKAQAL